MRLRLFETQKDDFEKLLLGYLEGTLNPSQLNQMQHLLDHSEEKRLLVAKLEKSSQILCETDKFSYRNSYSTPDKDIILKMVSNWEKKNHFWSYEQPNLLLVALSLFVIAAIGILTISVLLPSRTDVEVVGNVGSKPGQQDLTGSQPAESAVISPTSQSAKTVLSTITSSLSTQTSSVISPPTTTLPIPLQSYFLAWSPDGKTLATIGGSDRKSIIMSNPEGKIINTLKGHTGELTGIAWVLNGKFLASGSTDKTIRIWTSEGTLLT